MRYYLAVSAILAIWVSCSNDKGELPVPGTQLPCDTATVSFKNHIKPLISKNCAYGNCHVNNSILGAPEFTTYEQIKQREPEIMKRVFILKDMPPDTVKQKPGFCELRQLKLWLDANAPDN